MSGLDARGIRRSLRRRRMAVRGKDATLTTVARARAVLAGVFFGKPTPEDDESLSELAQLVKTAGGEVVGRVTQRLPRPAPGTCIGRGKLEELRDLVKKLKAHVVVFDSDLTPAQARNIEKALSIGVIERSELILGIFARNARSRAAKLQVELARHVYVLPRLRRMWTHLERQTGGIGLRAGAGERQIETDRRKLKKRIGDLKREIAEIESRTRRAVESRREHFTVSLVGYTNAGKSTLMRQLTGEDVLVQDRLFSTLDTRTAALAPDRAGGVEPPQGLKILVSDTVGFIRNLPHDLVTSFHATLEEARTADLLLHVADCTHPAFESQIRVVDETLEEIGAGEVPRLVVLNKIDALDGREHVMRLKELHGGAVAVSALTGEGLDELRGRIVRAASRNAEPVTLTLSAADAPAMRFIMRYGYDVKRTWSEDGTVKVSMRMRPQDLGRLKAERAAIHSERPAFELEMGDAQ
jgi:GTP-binding protein HflX